MVPAAGITYPGEVATGAQGDTRAPPAAPRAAMLAAGLGHWHFGVPGEAPHLQPALELTAMALCSSTFDRAQR